MESRILGHVNRCVNGIGRRPVERANRTRTEEFYEVYELPLDGALSTPGFASGSKSITTFDPTRPCTT